MWTWLSMQRQAGPGSSLRGSGRSGGSLPPCGRSKGLAGRYVQTACCPSWSQGRGETHREVGGRDKRGLGDGGGEVLVCSLPGSASTPSSAQGNSGEFPCPGFHLSLHSLQGAAVLSFNPALCILVLDMGTIHPSSGNILPPPSQTWPLSSRLHNLLPA